MSSAWLFQSALLFPPSLLGVHGPPGASWSRAEESASPPVAVEALAPQPCPTAALDSKGELDNSTDGSLVKRLRRSDGCSCCTGQILTEPGRFWKRRGLESLEPTDSLLMLYVDRNLLDFQIQVHSMHLTSPPQGLLPYWPASWLLFKLCVYPKCPPPNSPPPTPALTLKPTSLGSPP